MTPFVQCDSQYGKVERYFMSREDAERVLNQSQSASARDAAAQIISLMDELAAAVAAEREACEAIVEHALNDVTRYYEGIVEIHLSQALREIRARWEVTK